MSYLDSGKQDEVLEQREQIQMMSEALRKYKLQFERDKELRCELVAAKARIEQLSGAVQAVDQLNAALQQLKLQIYRYEGKIDAVKRERDILSAYCEERSKMIAQAAQTLQRHTYQLASKEQRIATLERENFELHSLISELQTQLQAALQSQTGTYAVYFFQLQQALRDRWKAFSSQPEKSRVAEYIDDFLLAASFQTREIHYHKAPTSITDAIVEDKQLQELEMALRKSQAQTITAPGENFSASITGSADKFPASIAPTENLLAGVALTKVKSEQEQRSPNMFVYETLPHIMQSAVNEENFFSAVYYTKLSADIPNQQHSNLEQYGYYRPAAPPATYSTNPEALSHFALPNNGPDYHLQVDYVGAVQHIHTSNVESANDAACSDNYSYQYKNEDKTGRHSGEVLKRAEIEKHMRICNSVDSEYLYFDDYQLMLDTDMLISRMYAKASSSIGLRHSLKNAAQGHPKLACGDVVPLAQPRCIQPDKNEVEEPKYRNLVPAISVPANYLLLTAAPSHGMYHSTKAEYASKDSYTQNEHSDTAMVKIFRTKYSMRKSVDYENSVDNEEECIEAYQLVGENQVLQQELLLAKAQLAALSYNAYK